MNKTNNINQNNPHAEAVNFFAVNHPWILDNLDLFDCILLRAVLNSNGSWPLANGTFMSAKEMGGALIAFATAFDETTGKEFFRNLLNADDKVFRHDITMLFNLLGIVRDFSA